MPDSRKYPRGIRRALLHTLADIRPLCLHLITLAGPPWYAKVRHLLCCGRRDRPREDSYSTDTTSVPLPSGPAREYIQASTTPIQPLSAPQIPEIEGIEILDEVSPPITRDFGAISPTTAVRPEHSVGEHLPRSSEVSPTPSVRLKTQPAEVPDSASLGLEAEDTLASDPMASDSTKIDEAPEQDVHGTAPNRFEREAAEPGTVTGPPGEQPGTEETKEHLDKEAGGSEQAGETTADLPTSKDGDADKHQENERLEVHQEPVMKATSGPLQDYYHD